MKRALRAAVLIGCCAVGPGVHAATCTVSAVSLAFGNYTQFGVQPTDTTGNIAVTCTGIVGELVAYSIAIGPGAGTFPSRRMTSAVGGMLGYNIYTTPARNVVWGDGSSGTGARADSHALTGPSVTRNYPVYGRILAGQKMPVGFYTDSVVVTLSF